MGERRKNWNVSMLDIIAVHVPALPNSSHLSGTGNMLPTRLTEVFSWVVCQEAQTHFILGSEPKEDCFIAVWLEYACCLYFIPCPDYDGIVMAETKLKHEITSCFSMH